jgi:hypothetical protein
MPDAVPPKLRLEIGHVLFLDIVGYSKLLISEQSAQLQKLKEIVRGTQQFRSGETEGKLLRLPTGDGGALVFRTSPEAPVECAQEISRAVRAHTEVRVRMGVHSGPVNEISDLNEQLNMEPVSLALLLLDLGHSDPRWLHFLRKLGLAPERLAKIQFKVTLPP